MMAVNHASAVRADSPHDASCTCGCRDHEHGPDAAQSQTHALHHAHGRDVIELVCCTACFESYAHEQASVVSGTVTGKASGFQAALLCTFLEACAHATKAEGGLVGHFKVFAKAGEETMKVSLTTALAEPLVSGNRELICAEGSQVDCALIAVGLEPSCMGRLVADALRETFSSGAECE